MERFAKLAVEALNRVLESPVAVTDLESPPDPNFGDFGFPCFKLSKAYRKSPAQVAAQISDEIQARGELAPSLNVAAVGPYVNFTVAPEAAMSALLGDLLSSGGGRGYGEAELGSYGSLPSNSRGSWVIEYSSPNVAKPLNIYHLRPTALGAALDRIGRYRGYRVISINHLGDWGKQYGMLAVAFKRFGLNESSDLSMAELVDLYVRINAEAAKDPTIETDARAAFLGLERGEPGITALWKKCVDVSMREFNRAYQRMGVKFDHVWGESFYKEQLAPLIERLKREGLLVESEGAWVVPVADEKGKELPPCIIVKQDGATIYATRDVAAALYRYGQFHFDRMTYIVGAEQKLHFQQVFGVLRKMGLPWASHCEHVPFGLYRFKDAKMSTRKGNFVTLESVLEEAKDRVRELMRERAASKPEGEKLADTEIEAITEAVAVGAVVYHDLHTDPARDIEFDLERVVDFEGETGPYLQYAHTRCTSILRKAGARVGASATVAFRPELVSLLRAPDELALVKMLGQFPLHLERTLAFSKASQLAHYLIDVTKTFGAFYRACHVLGDDPALTAARLMLVESTRRILARGLGLLGIPLPEKM